MRNIQRFAAHALAAAALVASSAAAFAVDDKFVEMAAKGGAAEVAAGNLAKTQGMAPAIKQYGEQMVTDHTAANDELKSIATAKGMTVPAAPDAKHQKALAKLQSKSGKDFDKGFKDQMVSDHKATVSLFEKQAKSGKDPELKAFAAKTLPNLKHHLEMAQGLAY